MLTLPLPILTFVLSLVACFLIWRLELGNRFARNIFVSAFGLMSLGTLLIALRFGYGFEQFVLIQRIIPLFIGPLIVFGFAAFIWPVVRVKRCVYLHLASVLAFVILMQVLPYYMSAYDVVIGLTYLGSIIALFVMWRMGQDRIVYAPLELARNIRRWMMWAAISLAVMVIFETSIAVSFALERMEQAMTLVSYGSVFLIFSLVAGIVVFASRSHAVAHSDVRGPINADSVALEDRARELLQQTQLFLDTDLTLERLARRLTVPARALSEAINQTQGINVSQYVNGFRLTHAADMLVQTDQSVSRVLERSGFLTRSNFYREFERVYQISPAEFRKQAKEKL
jgi:AraC-like DNA-binding protein